MVFAAVRIHFRKETPACLVDGTANNKQLCTYSNEHNLIRSGRLVEWLGRSHSIRAADVLIHEGGTFFVFIPTFSFLSFLM